MRDTVRLGASLGVMVALAGCLAVTPTPSPALPTDPPGAAPTAVATPVVTLAPATVAPSASPAETPPAPIASPGPSATSAATSEPTAEPTSSTSPTPAVTADPGSWVGPGRVSNRHYTNVSVVVSGDGTVHAAAGLGRTVWHVTNGTGDWIRNELSSPPSGHADVMPSITMDGAGTLSVAFERIGPPEVFGRFPEGIFLVTGGPFAWTAPAQLADPLVRDVALAAAADGSLFLAAGEDFPIDVVEDGQQFPIHFVTGLPGAPSRQRIARIGFDPVVAVGPDGGPRILLGDIGIGNVDALRYVTPSAGGGFDIEDIPGTRAYDTGYDLAIDSSGTAHVVWHSEGGGLWYVTRDGGGWSTPQLVHPELEANEAGVGVDASGAVHIVTANYSSGAWYFTNPGGSFTARQLHTDVVISADLGIDAAGRAHMLFVVAETFDHAPRELWYAAAPAL